MSTRTGPTCWRRYLAASGAPAVLKPDFSAVTAAGDFEDHWFIEVVLTSPPYFRLRDYHVDGQLGLETHVDDWVEQLRSVARELRRVVVPTGSFWLNVTDSYATHRRQGAARKSLLLGPERLSLALLDDGWIVRNKIVWSKPNSRPSSVRDRLSNSWEALYVFVRQPDYFFDLDAIRQPHTPARLRSRSARLLAGSANHGSARTATAPPAWPP